MFNVDTTVKNNQTSLFKQLISRHLLETSYTCDFNFAVLNRGDRLMEVKFAVNKGSNFQGP